MPNSDAMRVLCLVACLPLLVGCTHECNDMGCDPSATLEFATPLSEGGEYVIWLTTDTARLSCTAFVPLRRDGTEPTCEGFSIHREELTTRGDDAVHGIAGDDIASVSIGGHHDHVELTVMRDGATVLQTTVPLAYRGVEINGEGCGECPMATHTIEAD